MKLTSRILSLLLVFALLLGLMGTALAVFAEEWAVEVPAEEPAAAPAVSVSAPAEEQAEAPARLMEVSNLAQGKTATASEQDPNHTAPHAVDGDGAQAGTYWATRWGGGDNSPTTQNTVLPAWLQVDLGQDGALAESIVIKFRNDQYSNDYTISTSSTGENGSWTTIYTLSGRTGAVNYQTDTVSASNLSNASLQRYVRVTFTSMAYINKSISVLEFQVNGTMNVVAPNGKLPDSTNLCRPIDGVIPTASATSSNSDSPAANIIDGSKGTCWSSSQYQGGYTQSVTVDLGVVRHVGTVKTYWKAPDSDTTAAAAGYKIYTSANGVNWGDPVVTKSESPAANRLGSEAPAVTDTFTSVDARYIKLESNGYRTNPNTQSRTLALWELEVYGADNDDVRHSVTDVGNLCRPSDNATVRARAGAYGDDTSDTYVFDGRNDTYWSNGWQDTWNNRANNSWICIDLGEERDLQQIVTYWRNTPGMKSTGFIRYSIYTSTTQPDYNNKSFGTKQVDRLQYTPADSEGPNRANIDNLSAPIKARYVTIKADQYRTDVGTEDKFMSLWEVEMYSNQHYTTAFLPDGTLPDDTDLCRPGDNAVVAATASDHEATNSRDQTAAAAIDGTTTNWWATNNAGNGTTARWLKVDLGTPRIINKVQINWEKTNATRYAIETSPDGTDGSWTEVALRTQAPVSTTDIIELETPAYAQFIRLNVTRYNEAVSGWWNIAVIHFKVFGTGNFPVVDDDTPEGNLCRPSDGVSVTATADANETAALIPSKLIDGDTSTKSSRWSSPNDTAAHWVQIDLGALRSVELVKLYWERLNITAYTLKVSADGSTWETVHTCSARITQTLESISFERKSIRYLKLDITGHDDTGAANYSNASLYEIEVFKSQNSAPASAGEALAALPAAPLEVRNGSVVWTAAAQSVVDSSRGCEFTYAANYEQLVGPDGTVYQPLVNTVAKFDITVTDSQGGTASTAADSPISLTIPGQYTQAAGKNAKPKVIPELIEWYSTSTENFTLQSTARIVAPAALSHVAKELKADIKDILGYDLTVVTSGAAAGDIVLALGTGAAVAGYDDETYKMDIADRVTVTGSHPTGVYWGTRSLLQMFKLSADGKSAPKGQAKDYPLYKVRGFILDVGRKPVSMDMLKTMTKNMAWYKMNDFHVHVSDNLIFMEDYGVSTSNYQQAGVYDKANRAYSAFRLESSLQEEENAVAPLAARDYHYTKAEYKAFTEDSAKLGVNIVTEIDVPAHAKAIVDAFPSLRLFGCSGHPWNDHLDLSKPEATAKAQEIFADYVKTDSNGAYDPVNSVFSSTVHFGADEYYASHPLYRKFVKDMIAWLKNIDGVTPRLWGSLSSMSNQPTQQVVTKEEATGVQMNVWNATWSVPRDMYNLGFDLINCLDGANYIVPAAGYYGDKYGPGKYTWSPNNFGGTWIPASSSQMAGGAFAIWNDAIDTRANGIDEQDIFVRFYSGMPYYACALWGRGSMTQAQAEATEAVTHYAPGTNPENKISAVPGSSSFANYDFNAGGKDLSGNGRDLTLKGAKVENRALTVSGGSSYAETGMDKLAWGDELSFWVKVDKPGILFESDAVYDEYTVRALPVAGNPSLWHLGFGRELYDFEYSADLPVGEWVQLRLVSAERTTTLYVNGSSEGLIPTGSFLADANSNTPFQGVTFTSGAIVTNSIRSGSSFSIPVARLGSKTEAFTGALDDVIIGFSADNTPDPVDNGKYDIAPTTYTMSDGSHQSSDSSGAYAADGNASTMWHTTWTASITESTGWITVNLGSRKEISGYRYLPRATGDNGKITTFDLLVSDDNTNWTKVVENGHFTLDVKWQSVTFNKVTAQYVKLLAKETSYTGNYKLASAAEVRVCTPPSIASADIRFLADSYPLVDGAARPVPAVVLDGVALEPGVDFTVNYENNTAEGTATAVVHGAGAYTGQSAPITFTVEGSASTPSLADATVTLAGSYVKLSDAVVPIPVVTLGGSVLAPGKDYTVSYSGNSAVGEATVTLTGRQDFTGTKEVTFNVVDSLTVSAGSYDVASGTFTGTLSAGIADNNKSVAVLALYKNGALVNLWMDNAYSTNSTSVTIKPANPPQDVDSWGLFLLSADGSLKPLCAKGQPAAPSP